MIILFVRVTLAAIILLMVGQGQPPGELEAQDECEYYSLAEEMGKGWLLEKCGVDISYISPSGEECNLNHDAVTVFSCVMRNKET
jgi:hypothetical protein